MAPILDKQTHGSHFVMNEAAQGMDNLSHDVKEWADFLVLLFEDLEMFGMANDSRHPQGYEQMLRQVRARIEARLKNGSW